MAAAQYAVFSASYSNPKQAKAETAETTNACGVAGFWLNSSQI